MRDIGQIISESIECYLNECLLVEGALLQDVYNKYYADKVSFEELKMISECDPTAKNGQKGEYLPWLVREYIKNKEKIDINEFIFYRKALKWYDSHKQLLPPIYKDINKQSLRDIDAIYETCRYRYFTNNELKSLYDISYEDEDWIVYHPHTYEASRNIVWHLYGGSAWCISNGNEAEYPGEEYFHKYEEDGDNSLYILARKRDKNIFLYSCSSHEFNNRYNHQTNMIELAPNQGLDNWFFKKFNLHLNDELEEEGKIEAEYEDENEREEYYDNYRF